MVLLTFYWLKQQTPDCQSCLGLINSFPVRYIVFFTLIVSHFIQVYKWV